MKLEENYSHFKPICCYCIRVEYLPFLNHRNSYTLKIDQLLECSVDIWPIVCWSCANWEFEQRETERNPIIYPWTTRIKGKLCFSWNAEKEDQVCDFSFIHATHEQLSLNHNSVFLCKHPHLTLIYTSAHSPFFMLAHQE